MTRDFEARWWQRLGFERERCITDASPADDGGLSVVGWSETGARSGEGQGGFLTRIGSGGTVSWEFARDGRRPKAVVETPAGPVVAGSTAGTDTDPGAEPTAWLAAFTTDGECRWERGYPNGDGDSFETVVAIPEGVVAGGSTGAYARRSPGDWERVYGTRDWLLAVAIDDGTERWREQYYGNDCVSLVADASDTLRFVGGSRVVWVGHDGTEQRSQYYYAETGSSDTLDSIAPGHRVGESVIAGKAWEGSDANQARLLVVDADGEPLLDRTTGLPGGSNFGQAAVALDDGYVLSGTALFDGCSLPWLARFDEAGTQETFQFVGRQSGVTAAPELGRAGQDGASVSSNSENHLVADRFGDVDALVPVQNGLFVVYNERDRSQSPDHRQAWVGYLV